MTVSANDSHPYPIYNARYRLIVPLLDADGDPISPSAPDTELSQDTGTFADATNEATEIATASGVVYVDLIATELDTTSTAVIVKSTGAKTTVAVLNPRRLPIIRTGTAQAGAATTITLDSGASAIDDYYVGCYVNCTNDSPANVRGMARMITDYVGSTKVATVATWGTNPSVATTFEILATELWIQRLADVNALFGVAIATPATAGILDVNVKNIDNDAASASGTVTFPNATLASTTNITAGVITTATNVTTVNGLAANVITATSINADAITAAKISDNAIDTATFAAGTTIPRVTLADTLTTYTGNTPQTGDSFARIGVAGAGLTNIDLPNQTMDITGNLSGSVGSVTGNVGGNVVGSVASVTAGVTLAASAVQAIWDALTTALTTVGSIGKKLADWTVGTIDTYTGNTKQTGDAFLRLGAPAGASVSVDIAAVKAETASIQADTNDIQARLPAALTVDGNIKADTLRVGGTLQTAGDIIGDTNDIQARLPAALVGGRMDSNVQAMANDVLTAAALAADAVTEIQAGLSTLTQSNIRTAVGLASANLDTQLDAIPTVGETADQVWDELIAGHLGAGSTGLALNSAGAAGDPWSTALPGAYGAGTAGKIVGDNINAPIATVDTVVDAIKVKTDQLTFTLAGKVDASIQAAGDFAQGAADKVWLSAARTLTAFDAAFKTGYALSSAGVQAIWDALTAALTTAGSIGKLLVDNINATISSRSSHTAADVWAVGARTLTAFGFSVTVGTNNDKTGYTTTAADQQASADELLNRDLAGGASGGARIVRDALRLLRNLRQVVAGTLTVMQEDDATPAWTAGVTQTAGDPVSKIDPA